MAGEGAGEWAAGARAGHGRRRHRPRLGAGRRDSIRGGRLRTGGGYGRSSRRDARVSGEAQTRLRGKVNMGKVYEGNLSAAGLRFAIVISRFNSFITERLLGGAMDALARSGADLDKVDTVKVPG